MLKKIPLVQSHGSGYYVMQDAIGEFWMYGDGEQLARMHILPGGPADKSYSPQFEPEVGIQYITISAPTVDVAGTVMWYCMGMK